MREEFPEFWKRVLSGQVIHRPILDQNGSFKIVSNGLGLKFNEVVKDLIAGKKYFYRAYARNREGVGYGSVLDLKTVRNISPWWINAQPGAAANWWTSSWLGSFYMNDANASWVMHSELGWLYPMESPKERGLVWKEQLGWLWTDEESLSISLSKQFRGLALFLRSKPGSFSCSTITGMNAGCRWTVENSLTEFILPFYHAKY